MAGDPALDIQWSPVRRLLLLPPLSALLVVALPAASQEADLYTSAIGIVQDRYLWPDTLDAHGMLQGAGFRVRRVSYIDCSWKGETLRYCLRNAAYRLVPSWRGGLEAVAARK